MLLFFQSQLLETSQPVRALAALDASLAHLDTLPEGLPIVMLTRFNITNVKLERLGKLGRRDEVKALTEQNKRLEDRMGNPWDKKRELARQANERGVKLNDEAAKLAGAPALKQFHRALEEFKTASAEYPFDYNYWDNQRISYQWIANKEEELQTSETTVSGTSPGNVTTAASSGASERESALRGAVAAAWMARVLADATDSASAWKALYEARRSLIQFLRARGRPAEVLPLVAQGVLDAEEYARQKPGSADALFLLADANAGLGLLRADARNEGWEEAIRKGLAYRDLLTQQEPTNYEHWRWIGDFRRDLGDRLRETNREDAAVVEFTRALEACRQAVRLAAGTITF